MTTTLASHRRRLLLHWQGASHRAALRSFRSTPPAQVGPLIAGVGIAVVAVGIKVLLQAANDPNIRETVEKTVKKATTRSKSNDGGQPDRRPSATTAAAAKDRSSSYFTTDVMGVDLGEGAKEWSGACVAIVHGETARVVENEQGQRCTPSVVAFQDNGETLVGQPAKKLLFARSATTVAGYQLLLGLQHDSEECRRLTQQFESQFGICANVDGSAAVQVHGVLHTPSDIAARVLRQLKSSAERALGGRSVLSAVIGVPADAGDSVRAAVEASGRRAGLQQIELLATPLAAALAAEAELSDVASARSLAVFELNGSSSALSVLRRDETEEWAVVAARRQQQLGGEALDAALVGHLVEEFRAEHQIDLATDHLALQRLHEAAEGAKLELCSSLSTDVSLPFITADVDGPKHLNVTVSLARFHNLLEPMLGSALSVCHEALEEAMVRAADIDHVLLVGGATRSPPVAQVVGEVFSKKPLQLSQPEEAIALGATIHARRLQALQYGPES